MMGIVNLGAILEYSRASGVIRDSPSPNVGLAAARLLDVQPEKWTLESREC